MDKRTLKRKMSYLNLDRVHLSRCIGAFDMPLLEPEQMIPQDLIGFNYAASTKRRDAGIHFFLDDYQFERIWSTPEIYLKMLEKFPCVLTPDFSLYTDMPAALKIYNIYRNRLLGQCFQDAGLRVIPTVSWGERASFSYCFDGLPTHAVVAVSTLGVTAAPTARYAWRVGMEAMLERLEPKTVLIYGSALDIELDYAGAQVVYYKNKNIKRLEVL